MKASLILTAALALATSAAFAQTTPSTTTTTTTPSQTGTMGNGTTSGTMSSGTTSGTMSNGTMNSTTDRMGDMNGTDKSTMRNNKRMNRKGGKMKTNSDGSMKTKM